MSQLSIKVNIAGRTYPLTIDRSEEEMIRKSADKINSNIKNLQENYAVKDMQDLLAMTALQFGTQSLSESKEMENEKLLESLKSFEKEIDEYLEK